MQDFQAIAPYLTNPLALVGLALFLVVGVCRALLRSPLLRQVSATESGRYIRLVLYYVFGAGVLVIALSFGLEYLREAREGHPCSMENGRVVERSQEALASGAAGNIRQPRLCSAPAWRNSR
jgi:hypothetical protein